MRIFTICAWKQIAQFDTLNYPFKRQSHKMIKHTQKIADELFECVWPFYGTGA